MQPILATAMYRIEDLSRRAGVGIWALRQMRRDGLQVRYVGGRGFCLGLDFITYVKERGRHSHASLGKPKKKRP